MVYELPVMEEKVKPHQITTLHMVSALAFIVAGLIIVVYNYTIPWWGAFILLSGIALTVLVMSKNKWVISNKINPIFRIAELIIALGMAAYSFIQHWKFPELIFGVLSAAILFALYWEKPSTDALAILVDDEGIKLPVTSRRRFRPWTEIENVLLRFGTITVNFTDNSFIQMDLVDPNVDNIPFEAYCTNQVEQFRSKRRNDDW
jgi:hypothetical protein